MLSDRYLATGGGVSMETLFIFVSAVMGGVICHYIIKWLDGDETEDNDSSVGALPL